MGILVSRCSGYQKGNRRARNDANAGGREECIEGNRAQFGHGHHFKALLLLRQLYVALLYYRVFQSMMCTQWKIW